jgi:tetratricopeptide (TPR) repeat protein/tRNA A-37 threonylcarbamoyl transferase component Bud32
MIGSIVQHYRVSTRLGGGGMGEVYLAEDLRLRRQVALKFLSAALQSDPDSQGRLLNEARAASALRSPYIAVTYDIGEHEGRTFIAMEYVEGVVLAERVRMGPLPIDEAIRIGTQVAEALDEAHAHGIIHRDIKTSNLMLTDRGLVKVLDFGLAHVAQGYTDSTFTRLTLPGVVLGTLSYMAPEQAMGHVIDGRADLFSLGVVLYEMLTGSLPFGGLTQGEIIEQILHVDPVPPSAKRAGLDGAVDAVVLRALEKDRSRRFQSATELRDALETALTGASPRRSTGLRMAPANGRPTIGECCAVAVMTFANISREPADDWIGSGIAETVAADLKNVHGVTVISRARIYDAIKHLSGAENGRLDDNVAVDVGRRLGANWVVTGGYQRFGSALRITAQFLDARTGALEQTVKLDGKVDEIFALQDRIVFELLKGINLQLGSGEIEDIEQKETRSVEAFEAYSRGLMNLRIASRESIDRALALFERATTIDPGYAEAWAALGAAYGYKGSFMSIPELVDRAIEFERRALSLDPGNARALAWLGNAYLNQGRYDEAIAAIRQAVRLEPDNASAHSSLARAYWVGRGQVDEAISEFRQVITLNPEAGYAYLQLALLLSFRGRYDEAEKAALSAVDLQERYISGNEGMQVIGARARLGYIYYLQGRYDAAIAEYEREMAFIGSGDHVLRERSTIEVAQKLGAAWLRKGVAEHAGRYFTMAARAFEDRVAKGADDPYTRYYMAGLEALRGDRDRAIAHLEHSFAALSAINAVRARIDPDLDSLRSDSRFIALIGHSTMTVSGQS